MENEYQYWTELANRDSKVEVKPQTIVVDDEDLQININKALEMYDNRRKLSTRERIQDARSVFNEWHHGRPVVGKILILPRSAAKEFTYDKPWACISIADDPSELPKINAVQRKNLLLLTFLDRDIDRNDGLNYFKETHANEIIKFVNDVWDGIDLLMIHCYAGVSRSPAVGNAISDEYQPRYSEWFNRLFNPNELVYQRIKATQKERKK